MKVKTGIAIAVSSVVLMSTGFAASTLDSTDDNVMGPTLADNTTSSGSSIPNSGTNDNMGTMGTTPSTPPMDSSNPSTTPMDSSAGSTTATPNSNDDMSADTATGDDDY